MKIHFIGIGGSGVAGVAALAKKMGHEVTGCDLEGSTAYANKVFKGHDVSHIKDSDLVVVTPAVFYQNAKHPEVVEAEKKGILITWQKFVGDYLSKGKKVICIAGTHGKSTTTAMVGKILVDAGLDPSVVMGANVPEWGGSSRHGKGNYLVIEADEFFDNFLNYYPDIAVINNIEFDHPDYFKSEEQLFNSFEKFIKNLNKKGVLIVNWEDVGVRKLLKSLSDKLNKTGFPKTIDKVEPCQGGGGIGKIKLKVFGRHNFFNACMAYALGKRIGVNDSVIRHSLESFKGIKRRLELIGEAGGIKIFDDYAHHPTAIRETISALKENFKDNRVFVVIEPHGYERTFALLENYKGIFGKADKVFIGPIFKARDKNTFGITPQKIADVSENKNVYGFNSFRKIKEKVISQIKNGDVILVMGAGKSYLWAKEISESLPVYFSDLTTFKLGGKIKKYFEIKDKKEIKDTVSQIKKLKLPIFIIGEGSDVLVSNKNFEGAVVRYIPDSISFEENGKIVSEAGANWDRLVEEAVKRNLSGIESLSGIPGTVGASPIQNIGAYGVELKDTFVSLEAFDIKEEKFVTFTKEQCGFGYRESIFKQKENWQRFIITSVTFKLTKGKYAKTKYDSLKKYISSKKPTISEIREAVLKARDDKLENPKEIGNAGSFFKNPIIDLDKKREIESHFPNAKIFPFEGNTSNKGDSFKVYAGWLIEKAGWKGKVYKSAAVSEKHALILINKGGKSIPQDVFDLSEKIIVDVYAKFGIKLEREVQLINFD